MTHWTLEGKGRRERHSGAVNESAHFHWHAARSSLIDRSPSRLAACAANLKVFGKQRSRNEKMRSGGKKRGSGYIGTLISLSPLRRFSRSGRLLLFFFALLFLISKMHANTGMNGRHSL
ncbi:hypothetical protein AVEN_74569-1 [Araneus ventricosus]|uniref:Uncharacterized protein n=1 Tax=Araneus ventricosus TaxID=182803 RepID=A0A4Y2V5K4_ARAVE|nr:hypothetical protein AVEN_74569-1 [Araneus ventricosus]